MSDYVIIANLPSIHSIDPNSYLIVEKPGFEEGTFKATVGELQEATTVHAAVTQANNVTTISIKDINGTTSEQIVTPTATVRNNGNNTITIEITDTNGTTQQTIVQNAAQFDPQPTQGSNNLLTSGTVYTALQALIDRIGALESKVGCSIQLVE